jgi:RecA-family ATPase
MPPKGTGKTLAALAIARSVVTGCSLLDQGTTTTPGRVLYLATDSGCASMHTQMQELGPAHHARISARQRITAFLPSWS